MVRHDDKCVERYKGNVLFLAAATLPNRQRRFWVQMWWSTLRPVS